MLLLRLFLPGLWLQVRDFMGPQSTRSQSVMGPHPPLQVLISTFKQQFEFQCLKCPSLNNFLSLQRENSTPRSASMVAPQKVWKLRFFHRLLIDGMMDGDLWPLKKFVNWETLLGKHSSGGKCAFDWGCQCLSREGGQACRTTSGRVLAH